MSVYHRSPTLSRRFRLVHASFVQKDGLLFAKVLPEERVDEVFAEAGASPRQLSFATAMQTIAASLQLLAVLELAPPLDADFAARLVTAQLQSLPDQIAGHRPNRVEPWAVERRPKRQALLTKPRHEARAQLLAASAKQGGEQA